MKTKSFTLIELLVVIVIIGILAGVIIVSTSSSINKANFAKAQAFSNTVQQELLLNLVSEWTFDNESNPGEDTWGNNDGTVYGANGLPQLQTKENCVYGTCLYFDGVDDEIQILENDIFNLKNVGTISLWVKISSSWIAGSPHPNVLSKGVKSGWDNDGWGIYVFRPSDKRIGITIRNGLTINRAEFKNTTLDQWIYLVGLWDGLHVKIYKNGMLEDFDNQTIIPGETTTVVMIGKGENNYFYKGFIDDARVYNAALSASQIKQEYIAGLNSLLANNNISKEEYDQRLNSLSFK